MSNIPKKSLDPSIIAALIGVIGTIAVTLITIFANRPVAPQPTPVPPTAVSYTDTVMPTVVPTDTVPVGEPTSTPAPDTPTPESTFTPVPVLGAGADWKAGCISTIWTAYPALESASSKDGCYINFVSGLSVRDQRLQLSVNQKSVSSEELVGMFVQIPSDALIDINTHLGNIETGEVRIGIFQEPDIKSQGVMVAVPAGNPKNSAFAVHSMPADKREFISGKLKKDSADYLITFDVASGNTIVKFEKYTNVKPIDVQSDTNGMKWLFIGYKLVFGKPNTFDVNFFDLVITPR